MKKPHCHTMLLVFSWFFILHFVVSSSSSSVNTSAHLCSYDQSRALVDFKNSMSISINASERLRWYPAICSSSHPRTNSWHEGQDCCYWDGVTCDTTIGQVIGLDLSCSWLRGQLTSNSTLFLLQHLQILNLAHNDFIGPEISVKNGLPSSIGNLKFLKYLNISGCGISGSIPNSIGNLASLEHLDLSNNKLIGSIPNFSNLPLLHTVNLSSNLLTGTIPFSNLSLLFPPGANQLTSLDIRNNSLSGTVPSSLFTLPSLIYLDLSHNQLSGGIPKFISTSLMQLDLSYNTLQGNIPSSISGLANLTIISFSSNSLSGTIDTSMFLKLQNLIGLYGSNNSLSFTTSVNLNHSLPNLKYFYFSFNNLTEFPILLKGSKLLSYLDLNNNKIDGHVPHWFWDVGRDTLNFLSLAHNKLTGIQKLPWTKLYYLNLRSNLLRGPLPLPPHTLVAYFISNNSLTGDIPTLICNASSMKAFDLSRNYLTGTIPECLGNITTLIVLNLNTNRFRGRIPNFSGHNERSLQTLNLNGNQLEGKLPISLVNCKKLQVLDVGKNAINDTFPHWLRYLTELQVLVLKSNNFHGCIHDYNYQHNFQNLRHFDISNNNFVGSLPTKYIRGLGAMKEDMLVGINGSRYKELSYFGSGYYSISLTIKGNEIRFERILTIFMAIDFSNNKFRGEISQDFGTLISLKSLNLSHNNLVGHIPTSIGHLRNLESLDLSSNKLDGTIPKELASLTFLGKLNLSQNALVGPIPRSTQFDTFDINSYQGNQALCGPPLSRTCSNKSNEKPPPVLYKEEGSDDFDKKIVLYGYISGFVIGLSIGYMVLSGELPIWLVKMIQRYKLRKLEGKIQRSRGRN